MIILIMGVAGAGKTTIGQSLATRLGFGFADADSFHSAENIEKMGRGIPLTDADRLPWLHALHEAIISWANGGKSVVLACSALKRSYRDQLLVNSEVKLVYLKGSYELIANRLRARRGHYATDALLASQFNALEEPDNAVSVDIDREPEEIVGDICTKLAITCDQPPATKTGM